MKVSWWGPMLSLVTMASANLLRFRLRTVVVLLCLLSAVVPLLTALALQQGVKSQALAMLQQGPDLLVTGDDFGKPSSVPLSWVDTVRAVPGVVHVVPRAVGRVMIEDLPAVLVGIDQDDGAQMSGLPSLGPGELSIGAAIAGHYGIGDGDELRIALPVPGPERFRYQTFKASLLDPVDRPVWSAGLILGNFEDLQKIFFRSEMASELMIWCRPGYERRIALRLGEILGPAARVQDREMMEGYFHGGFDRRGGAFLVYFMAVLMISIPVLMLSSGFGLSARRREVAVMKCLGWETHEVLLLHTAESALVGLAGASLAVIISLFWLKAGSGWPLINFLMPGAEELPPFSVPYSLRWTPVLLAYVYSLSVTASGAIAAAWRAASVDPGRILFGGKG